MMGIRNVLAGVLAVVLALPLVTTSAEAANWWIERMSGNVQIHDGDSWVKLDQDRALNAGDSIWTGRNGRILLKNDQGSVLLAPKSLVKIPAQTLPDNFSVLFQTHGKVSAEVDKRRKRHFSIQTPYLAAVVKGTKFDVKVDGDETRVDVSQGLVGVVDVETGEQTDVAAGESLAVGTAASSSESGISGSREHRESGEDRSTKREEKKKKNGGGSDDNDQGEDDDDQGEDDDDQGEDDDDQGEDDDD